MDNTYYSIVVDYRSAGQGYDSGLQSSADTEHEALEKLAEDVCYYLALGRLITRAHIDRVCDHCNGHGEIFIPQKRNPRIGKNKRCPVCKGKSEHRVTTWIDLPSDCRARLATAAAGMREAV